MRTPFVSVFAALAACAGSAPARPTAPEPRAPAVVEEPAEVAGSPVAEPRTFGEQLAVLVARGDDQAGLGCSFRYDASGPAYVGPFAPALQPLPAPPRDVAQRLRDAGAVEVLTRYGRYDVTAPTLTLATFSDAPPCSAPLIVALGADGERVSRPWSGAAVDRGSAASRCAVLTADADVPLVRVADALAELEHRGLAVSLASALPPGASLPRAPTSAARSCPSGLPELDADAGELSRDQLRAALAPLKGELLGCLQGARSVAAQAGGVVQVALRIDPAGRVAASCAVSSELGDDAVVSCVLARAAQLRFPAPSPAGSVDVVLPLRLSPEFAPPTRALCE
jgi:hypothetical protein